jgi:GDP-L-fucose synthase
MNKQKIFIAGHKGMVGSALLRILKKNKNNIKIIVKERSQLNLLSQAEVQNFFKSENIDQVYLAAAKVGGIHANNIYPGDFIYENIMIQSNVINSAFLSGVKKLLFLGSSCIYPKDSRQPMREKELLNGKLEPTNEPYAIAKIAGIKMCESYNRQHSKSHNIDYRSVMPCNLFGPGDNYHPQNSHVIPGLIQRFHEAKINNSPNVCVWGTGKPKREFLFVDDMVKASIYINNLNKKIYDKFTKPMSGHINIGSGEDMSIKKLAKIIREVVGFRGKIIFDTTKPDGTKRKLMDSRLLKNLGFKLKFNFKKGLEKTYADYLKIK